MEAELIQCILADMGWWRSKSGQRQLASIHFGGGTPSLISAHNMARIISLAKELWEGTPDLEIGLEANPQNITKQALQKWQQAGIERLSIGVQSFDDSALKFLGRDHDGARALQALKDAVKIMPRVSADLIYGWAGQDRIAWERDLSIALSTNISHISAYQLTIEKRTAFAKAQARGQARAVDMDTSADLY